MNIWDALKTDAINKNVLLAVALVSLGLAGWMMASRKETLQQMQTLQVAHEGALLRIKELTDKLTEKDLEVEKVAKLSAEEAVKKIINIPELDKVLGLKDTANVTEGSSATPTNAVLPDETPSAQESLPLSTSNDMPSSENSASSSSISEKSETDLATSTPPVDQNSGQSTTAAQSSSNEATPATSAATESPPVPSETGSVGSSSSTSETPNTP